METSSILPEDLFEGILSRVPVKDLLRLRCVSKSWCSLIDNSRFLWTHHHLQYAMRKADGDVPLFLWKSVVGISTPSECYLLSKQEEDDFVLDLTADLERDRKPDPNLRLDYLVCRGSAKGIICFEIRSLNDEEIRRVACGLWNPATRDFKIVAFPDVSDRSGPGLWRVVGFGFDSLSNDFKILATIVIVSDKDLAYQVYSLSTGSWKRLTEPSVLGVTTRVDSPTMDACLNGVHYWTAWHPGGVALPLPHEPFFRLLSFNFSTEVFQHSKAPPCAVAPDDCSGPDQFVYEIGLYKESLALIFTRRVLGEEVTNVDIWVATKFDDDDFGIPLEWQCVLVVGPLTTCQGPWVRTPRMDGHLLFLILGDNLSIREWSIYNPETGDLRNLRLSFDLCFRYVESLYPLSRRVVQTLVH